jgi:hypothetical protein
MTLQHYVCGAPYVNLAHFHKTWDECYATACSPNKIIFDFLYTEITTLWKPKLVRRRRNKHRLLDYPEDGDNKLLRNVGTRKKLPVNTVSRHRRL